MDNSGHYNMQQWTKIVEAYFATNLVVLIQRQCRRDVGRYKAPDRWTIERLVAKFRETGSVVNASKGRSVDLIQWRHPTTLRICGNTLRNPQKINALSFTRSWRFQIITF